MTTAPKVKTITADYEVGKLIKTAYLPHNQVTSLA